MCYGNEDISELLVEQDDGIRRILDVMNVWPNHVGIVCSACDL